MDGAEEDVSLWPLLTLAYAHADVNTHTGVNTHTDMNTHRDVTLLSSAGNSLGE